MNLGAFEASAEDWAVAAVVIVVALLAVFAVDRWLRRREFSRETDTRLRFVRRLTYAAILLTGLALALSQFDGVNRIAASVLASGVVAAAIIGFAARQTLANVVAGVMLAITQPLRVGDWVRFEDHYGIVEDVRLNYTVLRKAGDERVVIPNEKLASGVLVNETLAVDAVGMDVAVWIPPAADAARAVAVLREVAGADVTVAETVPWGVRLAVGSDRVAPADRAAHEADLRSRCHARLREEGLLEGFGSPK
ncbi:MAG TPA: mechanosensitive ion channel domain-containing protein [Solirubrobacteraceae bacterium]|jgi:small-conductance mechanosensitive channel|nr:mechanosensitive ion channel domain-containing protein [Solirubrobacteraceae bacterium]